MRALVVVLALGLAAGCQRGEDPREPTAYQRDIDRICHAEKHSGALDHEPARRPIAVARWLGQNLETEKARGLLASLSQSAPDRKVALLEREAREAGVSDCPLAGAWVGGAAPAP